MKNVFTVINGMTYNDMFKVLSAFFTLTYKKQVTGIITSKNFFGFHMSKINIT